MLRFIYTILIGTILLISNNSLATTIPAKVNNQAPFSLAPMLKESMPSVVSISGTRKMQALSQNPLAAQNGAITEEQLSVLIGSGVIVDKQKGYILTNSHVVADLEDILVTLNDKRRFPAKLLGQDKASDLALLQIDADNLTEIKFADSDELAVGDFVVAIGNPYNFNHTVTSGIISALGRTEFGAEGYYDFIQTDAAINFGNSGGALLNLNGELVGINTVIISSAGGGGGSIGLGFAIPSNMAKGILRQLANSGKVDRGPLGVNVQNLNSTLAEAFGAKNNQGALIIDIKPNTPAAKANLEIGDIVLRVNQKVVKDASHLRTLISLIPPGNAASLDILHNKTEINKKVIITSHLESLIKGETVFPGLKGAFLEYLNIDPATRGFKVVEIQLGSPAANSDLLEGDIIIAANQKKALTLDTLQQAAKTNNKVLLLQVYRDKNIYFVGVAGTKS